MTPSSSIYILLVSVIFGLAFSDHSRWDGLPLLSSLHWYGVRDTAKILPGPTSIPPKVWPDGELPYSSIQVTSSISQPRVWQMCITELNGFALVVPSYTATPQSTAELWCWGSQTYCSGISSSSQSRWVRMNVAGNFSSPTEEIKEIHCGKTGLVVLTDARKLYFMGGNDDYITGSGSTPEHSLVSLMDGDLDLGTHPSRLVTLVWYEGNKVIAAVDEEGSHELFVRGSCQEGGCCVGTLGTTSYAWSEINISPFGEFPSWKGRGAVSSGPTNMLLLLGVADQAYYCGGVGTNHYTTTVGQKLIPTYVTCAGGQPYSDYSTTSFDFEAVRCVSFGCFAELKNSSSHRVFMSSFSSASMPTTNRQRDQTSESFCFTNLISDKFVDADTAVRSVYYHRTYHIWPQSYVFTTDDELYVSCGFSQICGVDSSGGNVQLQKITSAEHPDWRTSEVVCREDACLMFVFPRCGNINAHDPAVCGGRGICNDTDSCICDSGFMGQFCLTKVPDGGGDNSNNTGNNNTGPSVVDDDTDGIGAGAIAGIVIGVIVVVALGLAGLIGLIVGLVFYCRRLKTLREKAQKFDTYETEISYAEMDGKTSEVGGTAGKALLRLHPELFEIKSEDIKLVKRLGSGGFGEVYEVLWKGDKAAMKVFRIQQGIDEDYSDFEREVSIMGSVSHTHVVRFYGCTLQKGGRIGIVMALADGGDLSRYLSTTDVALRDRYRLLAEISSGMAHLHSVGIIHRDLKPGNILVSDGSVRIVDFGISKIVRKSETSGEKAAQHTRHVGTSFYMAPEVCLGQKYGPKVDVFAMGIIMWCVWNRDFEPYGRSFTGSVETRVATDDSFRPSLQGERSKEMPTWFRESMTACWAADPESRPDFADLCKMFKEAAAELS